MSLTAPPVRLPPPDPLPHRSTVPTPGGCLLCGVGAVTIPAVQVRRHGGRAQAQRDLWRSITPPPLSLGGRGSPEALNGYACPACAEAISSAGSVGATAMERALLAHLGKSADPDQRDVAERLRGQDLRLIGWGALAHSAIRRGEEPPSANEQPWGHLDISAL